MCSRPPGAGPSGTVSPEQTRYRERSQRLELDVRTCFRGSNFMYSLAQQQPTSVLKKKKHGRNKSPSTFLKGFKGWVNEMNLLSCSE